MVFSESIYFIILFTLPAAIHIIYNLYVRNSPRIQKDKSVELAESIVFCIFVFVVTVFVSRNYIGEFAHYIILSDADKVIFIENHPYFNYWGCIIKYTIITTIVSIGVIIVWYSIGKRLFQKLINFTNKKGKKPKELRFSDVWRNLFETDDILNKFECCLVIEKSGSIVTAGFLQSFQSPHIEEKEILLYNTDKVKEILDSDKVKSPDEKIFYPVLYEYYDVNADMLIKFYSLDKYDKMFS